MRVMIKAILPVESANTAITTGKIGEIVVRGEKCNERIFQNARRNCRIIFWRMAILYFNI